MTKNKVKKGIFETILNIFCWLGFFLAIILAVFCITSSIASEKNGKEIFGYKMLIVASDSMSKSHTSQNEPIFFESGDLIFIKTVKDVYSLKVGDVISFISFNPDSYGKTLTHKIREVNYSNNGKLIGYTTYGINTGVSDKTLVAPDTIIGVYSAKIPEIGTFFTFLKTPRGYFLSIIIPSVLLIMLFSIGIGKYIGRKQALEEFLRNKTMENFNN